MMMLGALCEYWKCTYAGGDERLVFTSPSQTVERVREWRPDAYKIEPLSKGEFMVLVDKRGRQ